MHPAIARRSLVPLAIAIALVVTGCGTGADPAPSASGDGPAAPTDVDTACAEVSLAAGAEIAGQALADCLGASAAEAGSGRTIFSGDGVQGIAETLYSGPATHVVTSAPQQLEVIVTDDEAWMSDGTTWVEGVANGTSSQQQVYAIGTSYELLADPATAFQPTSGASLAVVGQETVPRPDGTDQLAWHIASAAPFAYDDTPIESLDTWITDDFEIVQQQTVSTDGETTSTLLTEFYDWGAEIEIASPVA